MDLIIQGTEGCITKSGRHIVRLQRMRDSEPYCQWCGEKVDTELFVQSLIQVVKTNQYMKQYLLNALSCIAEYT